MRCALPSLTGLTLMLIGLPTLALGAPQGRQSFETCTMITSEYLTTLQLIGRGLGPETLSETLPDVSDQARKRIDELARAVRDDGLSSVYSQVNAEYARCAKAVYDHDGAPKPQTREAHFYICAGENKVRYDVLMSAVVGGSQSEVLPQLAPSQRDAARTIFELYQDRGTAAVFDKLADELKFCINNNL